MAQCAPQPLSTSSSKNSVWRNVQVSEFRKNVADLQHLTSAVPAPKQRLNRITSTSNAILDAGYVLPFDTERLLSDHFAMLVSSQPDAYCVTAAAIEERNGSSILRLASNGHVVREVQEHIRLTLETLADCARRPQKTCEERIFESTIDTLRERLHGRLQSYHWKTPKHWRGPKQPLYTAFKNLIEARKCTLEQCAYQRALVLCDVLETAEQPVFDRDQECQILERIVRSCYDFCIEGSHKPLLETASATSRLSQISKIARYRQACLDLTHASRRFPTVFRQMKMELLIRYESGSLPYSPGLPSSDCFVHAEVQLLTFYARDQGDVEKPPRAIGVSKSACYLCHLFFAHYNQFSLTRTHGKLYHQWTVPDVFNYSPLIHQRDKIRDVLVRINQDIHHRLTAERRNRQHTRTQRRFPIESEVSLPGLLLNSPLSSVAHTLSSISISTTSSLSTVRNPSPAQLPSPPATPTPKQPRLDTISEMNEFNDAKSRQQHPLHPSNLFSSAKHPPLHQTSPVAATRPFSPPLHQSTPLASPTSPPPFHSAPPSPPSPPSRPPSRPPSLASNAATLSSSSTIESWELPITHTLTPSTPIHARTNGLEIFCDMEHSDPDPYPDHPGEHGKDGKEGGAGRLRRLGRGKVKITDKPEMDGRMIRHTVDVGRMGYGECKVLEREGGEEEVVLNLVDAGRRGKGRGGNRREGEGEGGMTQVVRRWE